MSVRRLAFSVSVVALALVTAATLTNKSHAQEPLTVPTTVGQTVTVTWQGTVLPGANATSECGTLDVGAHTHTLDLAVPAGAYELVSVDATATITYDGPNDLIATVVFPDGSATSSDSGSFDTDETVAFSNPPAGNYRIIACMFAGAVAQTYTGTLTMVAKAPAPTAAAPCGAPKPLQFANPSYVDTHRAGGEPSVQVHPDGTLLYDAHAGTTHFYTPAAPSPTTDAFVENYRGQVYYWYKVDETDATDIWPWIAVGSPAGLRSRGSATTTSCPTRTQSSPARATRGTSTSRRRLPASAAESRRRQDSP
jgi:hypothetical protein